MIDSPPEELKAVQAADALEDGDDIKGRFLKISEGGISVPDFVKRLDENDILVAIDGHVYLDGKKNLKSTFIPAGNTSSSPLASSSDLYIFHQFTIFYSSLRYSRDYFF